MNQGGEVCQVRGKNCVKNIKNGKDVNQVNVLCQVQVAGKFGSKT